MELGLSLGETPKGFSLIEIEIDSPKKLEERVVSFSKAGVKSSEERKGSSDPPTLQLNLLPSAPPILRCSNPSNSLQRIPWLNDALGLERVTSPQVPATVKVLEGNRFPLLLAAEDTTDEGAALSSPNSAMSSFQMDFSIINAKIRKREHDRDREGGSDDDEENGSSTRKKLRLSKEQSAFLEDSFKEHTSLNPKQKLALAKQLNLRPRQVEVWFQNRRARTKLKQTEVDCEYLKRCCESLTEENRRLQKELQELRALKTSQPFYMQLPATTLTMCPSCERVATTGTATNQTTSVTVATTNNNNGSQVSAALCLGKPGMLPLIT